MDSEKIKKEISKKEAEIKSLKQKLALSQENIVWIKVPGTNFEVTKDVLHKNKSYDDLKSEFGEQYLNEHLLTLSQIEEICKHPELMKKLKMDGSSSKDDFFIKQPFPQNEKKGYVAWFFVVSVMLTGIAAGILTTLTLILG